MPACREIGAIATGNVDMEMKRFSTACILGIVSSLVSVVGEAQTPNRPSAAASKSAESTTVPYAPIRLAENCQVAPAVDMFYNGRKREASSSGPVNTQRPDAAYFRDPRFNEKSNTGRLFYHQFFFANPHDPHIQERRYWYICWSPLDDGERAQRLYILDGFFIEEVTTDGKSLRVHHTAYSGTAKRVHVYKWEGDPLGNGRFALEDAPPPNAMPAEPTPFEIERDRGYAHLSARKYDQAQDAFEKALKLKPRDAATLFALGVSFARMPSGPSSSSSEKAIAAFGQAIGADPKRTAAYEYRAHQYLLAKKYDLAIADATAVIAHRPGSWEAYMARANVHARKGDYQTAIRDTQQAARLGPEETPPWESSALYQYRAGQFEAAIESGRKALSISDSKTLVRVIMACAYARLGMTDKALKEYADAKANGVTNPERRSGIGELQSILKNEKPAAPIVTSIKKLLEQFTGPDKLEPSGDLDGLQ